MTAALMQHTPERLAPLLDVDPDLGQLLPPEQAREAHQRLFVRLRRLPTGRWDAEALTAGDSGNLGLLMLEGFVMREVLANDVAATELLGPGDLLRPWHLAERASLLESTVRWSVLADTRVALLDRRLAQELGRFPEVMSLLIERTSDRSQRLAVTQAIAQHNRVDDRLIILFWHLAERWGRMGADGVIVPLTLSHRLLAQLAGARRPTVTTAIGELRAAGEIARRADGAWLLTGSPAGRPDARITRFVSPRRGFTSTTMAMAPRPAPGSRETDGRTSTLEERRRVRTGRLS